LWCNFRGSPTPFIHPFFPRPPPPQFFPPTIPHRPSIYSTRTRRLVVCLSFFDNFFRSCAVLLRLWIRSFFGFFFTSFLDSHPSCTGPPPPPSFASSFSKSSSVFFSPSGRLLLSVFAFSLPYVFSPKPQFPLASLYPAVSIRCTPPTAAVFVYSSVGKSPRGWFFLFFFFVWGFFQPQRVCRPPRFFVQVPTQA